ncbi:MAG: hypothetical protein KF682_18240, partial [Nitrospira sp.]|nr:hypothetical protein [Nitrospira sp.]
MTVNDTTELRSASTEYDSLRDFFANLAFGTLVTTGQYGAEFIYTGMWKHNSHNEIELIVRRTTEAHCVDVTDTNQVWRILLDDNGVERKVDQDTVRALDQLHYSRRATDYAHKTLAEETEKLDARIALLRSDFQKLNTFLNEYAEQERYCGEYEDKLEEWNSELSSESNLVGRKQLRSVRVRMTKTWDCWVEVEATSDRDARDKVE